MRSFFYAVLLFVVWGSAAQCFARDITLNITVSSNDNVVGITVSNDGQDSARKLRIGVELDGVSYPAEIQDLLLAGQRASARVKVTPPSLPGSYPLIATVFYENEGEELSLVNAGYFHYKQQSILDGTCPEIALRLRDVAILSNPLERPARLVMPQEFQVLENEPGRSWAIVNRRPQFSIASALFLVVEDETNELHSTSICRGAILSRRNNSVFSFFPTWSIVGFTLIGLFVSFAAFRKSSDPGTCGPAVCTARAGFSLFLVAGCLVFTRLAGIIPDLLLGPLWHQRARLGRHVTDAIQSQLDWFYFQGGDYDFFFRYAADAVLLYFLFGNYWVLRRLIRPVPATDKYWHLMRSFFSVISRKGFYWSKLSKVGLLAFFVKIFYAPMLTSWTVNNVIHQWDLVLHFHPNFEQVNEFLVALLIFVDVLVFTVGYYVELPSLKNTIRSVEPTLFGWAICIICYPPFNQMLTHLIDLPLKRFLHPYATGFETPALIAVTLLWAIYVWATVALGFKSSNLTNRGIVTRGPYAFVRHPAYISKVSLWAISAVFLGTLNLVLVPLYAAIYGLRAWTEERHLSQDPEYSEYKDRVRWKLLPGIW